jgi:heat shock protein HtpX
MKRRAGHNMLTISHLALALPRATAFTNYRRRFQPRVVLRGMGTEQLGAVAAPGVRVRAPWRNGQLYPGQVTSVEGDKVSIKFDDGDKREGVTWNDCAVGPADDMPEPAVGLRVMAPWKNRHMYPGRVGAVSKSKDKVKINFDDDDELVVPWTACRLRDAPRTSYKRPQSLSDSLSYAGLTDSQLKPRAQPAHESALKWIGFAATLAAISGIMHFAGTLTLFDIALNTWDRAAVIYPLCAISSVIWNMVHYDRKDSAAIAKAMGGFESNDAALRAMVGAVHAMSGLGGDAPKVYIIPSDEPNAFAAGTKASVVAVTTGLLELLSPRELRAVLAHEIGHVRNRDMARSLGAGCMVAGLGFAMTIGDYLVHSERSDRRRSRGKKSKNDKKDDGGLGSLGLILYASGAITQAMGTLLRMMHSRTAEYAADAFAKSIGAGADLASALEKLEASHAKVTKRDEKTLGLAANAFAASYIDNPPERDSWLLTMGGWLRTHPRNQDRIERLLA